MPNGKSCWRKFTQGVIKAGEFMSGAKKYDYERAFHRSYGVFTREEQEKIRKAKIVIVGCGGVGGGAAVLLARSGVENLTIVDPDIYEILDINRQIACFTDTLGKSKIEVLKKDILRINPNAKVSAYTRVAPSRMEEMVEKGDIVVAVSDDFATSIMAMRAASKLNKPYLTGYPTGALARICAFPPSISDPEKYFALPTGQTYETLRELTEKPRYRRWGKRFLKYYKEEGYWTEEWFDGFIKGKLSFPQIAPIVWITASLVSLEVLKLITGKWKPVTAPRHWHVVPGSVRIEKFKPPSRALKVLSYYLKLKGKVKRTKRV